MELLQSLWLYLAFSMCGAVGFYLYTHKNTIPTYKFISGIALICVFTPALPNKLLHGVSEPFPDFGFYEQFFGNSVALEKLDELEKRILELGDDPYIGTEPRYLVLKRQGYKVLILEKDLVFYKIDETNKKVIVYTVVDQRQDYVNILRGL